MTTRRIQEFLDDNAAKYLAIHHSPAYTAQEVAASAHIPGRGMAKTVVVKIDGRLALAVVPAMQHVDMTRVRDASGADQAELAGEEDFRDRFEGCELGAMPPFGNLFDMETFVDQTFAGQEKIAFNAGSHTDVIAMPFDDYARLVHPHLAKLTGGSSH
jgi:Ala-tRNA(Pro) deacylase